ncbi:secretion system protein [Methanoculleus taiwanensis]|uniref:Secretion system protein n=1 Tax=Methanoculleus taiwanensis TaxID=1550565 RepID=A0A498H6J0_9EURY|nr:type II secretion system F family protein [Methanoculleus taiwanensis]RXE57234.1 secretion system protein [Methanoculleus taiwanensis]
MGFKDVVDNFLNRDTVRSRDLAAGELDAFERQQQDILDKIEHNRKTRVGFGKFVKNPVKYLSENPVNILYISVPVALIVLVGGFFSLIATYGVSVLFSTTMVDDVAVFALLAAIIPLALLDFKESRRVNSIEESLPNFFRDVAGMNDSGMTLPHAVRIVSEGEYGTLTPHIRELEKEMSWSVPFVEAIRRFGIRVNTPLAARSVDLIAHASAAGGDVSEVLRAAANDAYEFFNLKSERQNNMMIYMIIVLMSFFVFLFVIAVLSSTFLATMAEAGKAVAASGASGQFMGSVNLFLYNRLFCHAALIQGFFSGLAAGVMGEGRAIGGLKYSAMMVIIAWIAFRFFI